jgi:hypothetical protein
VADYQKIQDKYKGDARTILKSAAKLEVTSRDEKLRELLIDTLIRLARNLAIKEIIKVTRQGSDLGLIQHQHALKAACHFLNGKKMTVEELKRYSYPKKLQLQLEFDKIIAVLLNHGNDEHKLLSNHIVDKLWAFFPNMTVDLWKTVEEEEFMS